MNTDLSFASVRSRELVRVERLKIAFQFLLMTVCSLVIGHMIARALSDDFYKSSVVGVSSHFETLFINCTAIYDYISCILRYSIWDIACVAVIFFVSFAAFNYSVTDIVLVCLGVRCGLSVSFLAAFIRDGSYDYGIGVMRYIVFVFFKVTALLLILNYSYVAAVTSTSLRRTAESGRLVIHPPSLIRFLLYTIACVGSLIVLSGLYCWLIYLLK